MKIKSLLQNLSFNHLNNVLGIVIGVFATLLYTITLEPTSSFWDSGEYIAASYKLEIPHPPGAPLFLLFGRLFALFSFGDQESVAFAVNMLSAVSSGLAVMFLYWTIVMLARKFFKGGSVRMYEQFVIVLSGLIGALSFAFTDTFWYSATETELYAFSTFITALVFWAIFKWEGVEDPGHSNRWLILIAYIMGLSVGVHLLNLLTIPSIALVVYFKRYNPTWKSTLATLSIAAAILTFILFGLVSGANVAKGMEIFLVNTIGLPFGSGMVLFALLLIGGMSWSLWYTYKRQKVVLNTVLLGLTFIIIGYSSYTTILIRANYDTPINQNNPHDLLRLISYINMEQYPTRPLLYGKYFTAQLEDQVKGGVIYERGEEKYEIKDHKIEGVYDERHETILPRMYSTLQPEHAREYRRITGLNKGEKPSFSDNLYYFFSHQLGHMYLRYFMWNFVGREGSVQGSGWLTPTDKFESLPALLQTDKARNNYLMIPLILGLIGLWFMYSGSQQQMLVTGTLFIMTGLALVVYINAPPVEPRERDYIYIGSYYAFAIWMGLGILGIYKFFQKMLQRNIYAPVMMTLTLGMLAPAILLYENYDDHDRSDRYYGIDQAKNLLTSCAPNAILFTGGDNDTYPLWYAQEVEGVRTDVRVIVLSYANADWYIDQFYEKVNDSDPLPLSLTKSNYKQGGLNDYLPYVPNPNIQGPINTGQLIRLIKEDHPNLQVSASFDKINMVPANQFYTRVNRTDVVEKGIVASELEPMLTDKMTFSLKGRGLEKKDLLIMDLIDTNRWERPIYFNFTSLSNVNLDLEANVVREGNTYRLLPVQNPDDEMLINEELMYDNVMKKSIWRDLRETDAFFDDYHKNFVSAQRNTFNVLAQSLIDSGNVDKATEVLHKSLDAFPDEVVPYDLNNVQTAELLLALHDKDTADNVSRKVLSGADEFLGYLHHNDSKLYERQKALSLIALRNLARIYDHWGYKKQADEFADVFMRHYEALNG